MAIYGVPSRVCHLWRHQWARIEAPIRRSKLRRSPSSLCTPSLLSTGSRLSPSFCSFACLSHSQWRSWCFGGWRVGVGLAGIIVVSALLGYLKLQLSRALSRAKQYGMRRAKQYVMHQLESYNMTLKTLVLGIAVILAVAAVISYYVSAVVAAKASSFSEQQYQRAMNLLDLDLAVALRARLERAQDSGGAKTEL